jgi:hypothetical protein
VAPGSRLNLPWPRNFSALVYVLAGDGYAGPSSVPLQEGHIAVFGPGEALSISAAAQPQASAKGWEVLALGGTPIREPVARYGPFVMNTAAEIYQAIEDYRAGKMGIIPVQHMPHRTSADARVPRPTG